MKNPFRIGDVVQDVIIRHIAKIIHVNGDYVRVMWWDDYDMTWGIDGKNSSWPWTDFELVDKGEHTRRSGFGGFIREKGL